MPLSLRCKSWLCFDAPAAWDSLCATGYPTGQVLLHPETPLHSVKAPVMGPRQSPQPIKPIRALCLVWVLICLLSKMSGQLQPDPRALQSSQAAAEAQNSGGRRAGAKWAAARVEGAVGRPGGRKSQAWVDQITYQQLTIGSEAGMQNLGKTIVYPMT